MENSSGTSASNSSLKTHLVREISRGTILKSKTGLTTVKVRGFGFMGHSFIVIDAHPLSAMIPGDKGWTGQCWRHNWEVA